MFVPRLSEKSLSTSNAPRLAQHRKRLPFSFSLTEIRGNVFEARHPNPSGLLGRLGRRQNIAPVRSSPPNAPLSVGCRHERRYSFNSVRPVQSAPLVEPGRRQFESNARSQQGLAVLRPTQHPTGTTSRLSHADYLGMLDYYETEGMAQASVTRGGSPSSNSPPRAPSPPEDFGQPATAVMLKGSQTGSPESGQAVIQKAISAIDDPNATHADLFNTYRAISTPGVLYLSETTRNRLLDRLAMEKGETATLRYLSIIEDMKRAHIPLSTRQWNQSLHLAGRCFARVTSQEVESALNIWKEMEGKAGIKSDITTFNILLDIANKGGQMVLADMLLKEMAARKLKFDRFTYYGLITFHGIRHDGAGVRQAYKELVLASEVVDTSTLNCVIAAFIRAGEFPAAMQVYERMLNRAIETGLLDQHRSRKESREMGATLARWSARHKHLPSVVAQLQARQTLAPNLSTYIILVKHHAKQTSELQPVAALLDEMHSLGIPIHGRLFMELFRGFANHGNEPYTPWNRQRLQQVWDAFLRLVEEREQDVFFAKWIVIWILRAYAKCLGRTDTLHIWEEIKSRWHDANEGDLNIAASVMARALEKRNVKHYKGVF